MRGHVAISKRVMERVRELRRLSDGGEMNSRTRRMKFQASHAKEVLRDETKLRQTIANMIYEARFRIDIQTSFELTDQIIQILKEVKQ